MAARRVSFLSFLILAILVVLSLAGCSGSQTTTLMKDTPWRTNAYVIGSSSGGAGPTVMVLGGVHGDEDAGWVSAGQLLRADVRSGTLVVVPRCNQVAIRRGTREGGRDLNRSFPGSLKASGERRLAAQIMGLVRKYRPSVVLTYHVSQDYHATAPRFYGQTVVFDKQVERPLAARVVKEVNKSIKVPREKFVCVIDNMPGSATHEVLDAFKTGAYGIETASPMGLNDCVACHLAVTREFCDDVGLEIANWDSILN